VGRRRKGAFSSSLGGGTRVAMRAITEANGMTVRTLAAVLAVLAGSVGCSSTGGGPGSLDVTGTFATTYSHPVRGTLTTPLSLTQSGTTVTGSYIPSADAEGHIEATLEGDDVVGSWVQGSARGPIKFSFSADGKGFTGSWDYASSPGGYWNGTRTSDSATAIGGGSSANKPQCSSDSSCSGHCSGSCYACRSGSCTCGYKGVSGSCIY
jgi:hypothetical protein